MKDKASFVRRFERHDVFQFAAIVYRLFVHEH